MGLKNEKSLYDPKIVCCYDKRRAEKRKFSDINRCDPIDEV